MIARIRSKGRRARKSSLAIVLLAFAAGCVVLVSPLGGAIDRASAPLRFAVFNRTASGNVVVVEMDARSAAAIKRWPWSRANYAEVVDRLRVAGAASIVFDVDFSSASDAAGDAAFAAALQRAEGLAVLPTFAQAGGSTDERSVDALPIAAFRDHVVMSSVSVSPDADGQVRSMPFATITAGTPRPSLSAVIAHQSGQADATFPIDMSTNPTTIPRLSFIDVRNGRFDPATVRGRNMLIGATAIEMGDRYATPRWGVVPGVIIQALAAETLFRGTPSEGSALFGLVLALVGAAAIAAVRGAVRLVVATIMSLAAVIVGVITAQYELLIFYPLAPALAALVAAATAAGTRAVLDRMRRQRLVDEDTGLPNRRALVGDLTPGDKCAIVAARIAEFDKLSAGLGPAGAIDLIKRIRDRISVLGGGLTVYRIEDRVLAWRATVDAEQVQTRYEQLRAIMLSPIDIGGRKIDVSLSIGFAEGAASTETIITNAALAADLARSNGTGWHVHSETDLASADTEISLISDLEYAMAEGQVTVVYQPKLDLQRNRIASVEALVRWHHPTRGMIRPDYFIPLVEKANRIEHLTFYVLRRAIADMRTWNTGGERIRVAINLSAVLFESRQFIDDLHKLVRDEDVDPTMLIFEVTESAAMRSPERAIDALTAFKALGVSISVDDYGTGQSTLSYLKKLPLDELKIDRSFVEFAHQNRGDAVLVRSTVDLAHELGLKVVAEGVETHECLEFLRSVGCDMAQGYLISRPVPSERLQELTKMDLTRAA